MGARILRGRRESGSISLMLTCLALAIGWFPPVAAAAKPDKAKSKERNPVAVGSNWFTHQWKSGDEVARGGDGVGPMFNARSCAECHNQGGIGGAGGTEHNVQLLSAQIQVTGGSREKAKSKVFIRRLGAIHPDLAKQPVVVLHRFGTSPLYGDWRLTRLAMLSKENIQAPSLPKEQPFEKTQQADALKILAELEHGNAASTKPSQSSKPTPASKILARGPIALQLSERNTTALFGDGLIDDIPDSVIKAQVGRHDRVPAEAQPSDDDSFARMPEMKDRPNIVGKASIRPDGHVGKFGWKGQHATLEAFTLAACAVEVGLEVPENKQAANPQKPNYLAPGYDLKRADVNNLMAFISALPAPRQVVPDEVQPALVLHGELLFGRVGCAACHVRKLGDVDGIYSDLLLHDMGGSFASSGSYGVVRSEFADILGSPPDFTKEARPTEWRTPPLWGVADSAPYLHDGRAATLEEAITAHAGTASWSATQYGKLSTQDRASVLWFLQSLRAPDRNQLATLLADNEPNGD